MALSERDRRTVTIGGSVVGVLLAGFVLFSVLGGGEEPFPPIPDTPLPTSSPESAAGRRRLRSRASPGGIPSPSRPLCRPSPLADGPGRRRHGSPSGQPVRRAVRGRRRRRRRATARARTSAGRPWSCSTSSSGTARPASRSRSTARSTTSAIGEQFAGGRFELRSVAGNCATFLFGDESFTLCINAAESSSGDPPTGGAVAGRGGGARAAPALRISTLGRPMGSDTMLPCSGCSPPASPTGRPRRRPRGHAGGRAGGSEADRGRARAAPARARPRRPAEARDRRASRS